MKKMLVVFLILFTKALADSEEDKYVDLLPDEEKQQFLENVARRILKDVESQENVKDAKSGDLSDEQLKQHTEYVKSILREEQANVRRNKGGNGKKKEEKPRYDNEKDNLGVKPLASAKISLSDDREDLTLRKDKRDAVSDESTTDNIKNEMVTDNAPIIKRSVQDEDNSNKSIESDETNSGNAKSEISSIAPESKDSPNFTKNKDLEIIKSTKARDEDNERVEGNQSGSSEGDARNVSVKGIHELRSRRLNNENIQLVENTTENNTTTTTVEGVNLTENKSDEYDKVSTADEESTTLTYLFESSTKGNTESTTTDDPLFQSTTVMLTNEDKDSEPIMKSRNDTLKDTENKLETTTKSTRRSTIHDQKTTEPVPETTESIPETTTGTDTEMTEVVTEPTTVLTTTKRNTVSIAVVTTEEPKIVVEDFTSSPTIQTSVKSPKKNNKYTTIKQHAEISQEVTTATPDSDEESIEGTTKNIIKHKVIIHKPRKVIVGPKAKKMAAAQQDDIYKNNFIELEKVYFDNNYKLKVGKQYHVYEIPPDDTPFIKDEEPVVDQPYFVPIYNYSPNNAYFNPQNRLGPNARDSWAENILNDFDDINQQDKTETLNVKMEYDRTFENKRKKFGSKQILSQNNHRQPQQNNEPHKTQEKVNPADYLDSDYYFGRVKKALARRAGSMNLNKFPNSDEMDHPTRSIQEGSLKDHVRAVRNILFHHKSFGLLDKDKYGASIEQLRMGHRPSESKALRQGTDDDFKTANNKNEDKGKSKYSKNNVALDDDFGRDKPTITTDIEEDEISNKHFKRVGYLKKKNNTKELYVMDDIFKANVEKYIQEKGLTLTTSLPNQSANITSFDQRDEIIAYLRQSERQKRAKENNINNVVKRDVNNNAEIKNTAPYPEDIPLYSNEMKNPEKGLDVKFNLRRNEVDKVQVYLEVLKDMVTLDNKALVQYDWLGTTVDIQAALQKLFELNALVADEEDIHPADIEILKYVLFQHKLACEIIEANDFGAQLRKKLALPRNKKKKLKPRMLKEKGLINRVWLYLRKEVPQVNEYGALKNLNTFLINVEDGLYDLHDAIKNIAKITKYKNQHWYQNLRDLYLKTDEKHILELLLHLTALRLFSLIEESAKNGLEEDYIQYMKQNRQHCKRTLEEMMFIIDILDEYNKFVE